MDEQPTTANAQAKPRRRWYQFGLRTLLIGVTLAGCGLGWLGIKIRDARQQEAAVAAILRLGGSVVYDDELAPHELSPQDIFRQVHAVELSNKRVTDADLGTLDGLTQIKGLELDGARVTDASLDRLETLTQLEWLSVRGTMLTRAGVARLRQALPNCKIER